MKNRKWIIVLISVFTVTAILIILGILFNKSEFEKIQGLTEVYDVSADGLIAYVFYEDGESIIYLNEGNDKVDNRIIHLDVTEEILDINFSPDGTSFAYIKSTNDPGTKLQSSVHLYDLESMEDKEVFHDSSLITEIKFDPKEDNVLFYLRAKTFENYSPIARARPHEFDLFSYNISNDKRERHTNLDKYSMTSLQVSETDPHVFIQMDDDIEAQSAEDIFATTQKIFQVPLDTLEELSIISPTNWPADIYDFTIVPNKPEIIFQSASNFESNDSLFQYELYHFDWESGEEKQLTFLKESASKPMIGPDNTVYFIVDKQFGKEYPDYHLYELDLDGENIQAVPLKQNDPAE